MDLSHAVLLAVIVGKLQPSTILMLSCLQACNEIWLYACKVVIMCTSHGLQEMDIIHAAQKGSLDLVENALKAGVSVDTSDGVRE